MGRLLRCFMTGNTLKQRWPDRQLGSFTKCRYNIPVEQQRVLKATLHLPEKQYHPLHTVTPKHTLPTWRAAATHRQLASYKVFCSVV